jgi:hypothetical protein
VVDETTNLFEFIATKARQVFNRDHHHIPMAFLELDESQAKFDIGIQGAQHVRGIVIIPLTWNDSQDRDRISFVLKLACRMGIAKRIAFLHEVWMLNKPLEKGEKIPDSIANHPDAISVLFLNLESKDGTKKTGYWPIKNPDTNMARLEGFEEVSHGPDTGLEGRFADFFEQGKKN